MHIGNKYKIISILFIGCVCLPGFRSEAQIDSIQGDLNLNDRAIDFFENDQIWQAVQFFERAVRTGPKKGIARANLAEMRTRVDLPAHSILHFGWIEGVGRLASFLPGYLWVILSLLFLLFCWLPIVPKGKRGIRWSICLLVLSFLFFMIGLCAMQYTRGEDLVIFKNESKLKERPYESVEEGYTVFEGQMARLDKRYDDQCLVTTDTYESGWVPCEDLTPIWE